MCFGDSGFDLASAARRRVESFPVKTPRAVWMDGRLVPWKRAAVHVMSHSLHYGSGVFEGIRCYDTPAGPRLFRAREHVERLLRSARCMLIDAPWRAPRILRAIAVTIRANGYRACYVRPLIYRGLGGFGVNPLPTRVHLAIAVWEWGAYLGRAGIEKGIRLATSHWIKNAGHALPTKAKVTGAYANSVLAKAEAVRAGCEEALLLDQRGFVAEGSGENVFFVRDGLLQAIDTTAALAGITRASVLTLARDLGIETREGPATLDQLYNADEVFMTGTAAEVTPVREIDGRRIGPGRPGPVTRRLAGALAKAVRGEDPAHRDWCASLESLASSR